MTVLPSTRIYEGTRIPSPTPTILEIDPEKHSLEDILTVVDGELQQGDVAREESLEAQVYRALCLGVRDYVDKNVFERVVLVARFLEVRGDEAVGVGDDDAALYQVFQMHL